jgi:hypothetical protein
MVFPPLIECAGAGHFGAILNQVDMHDNVIARLDRAIQCPQSDGYRITRSSRANTDGQRIRIGGLRRFRRCTMPADHYIPPEFALLRKRIVGTRA